jgi:hypothetical protein
VASTTATSQIGLVSVIKELRVCLAHLTLSDGIVEGCSLWKVPQQHSIFEIVVTVVGVGTSVGRCLLVGGAMAGRSRVPGLLAFFIRLASSYVKSCGFALFKNGVAWSNYLVRTAVNCCEFESKGDQSIECSSVEEGQRSYVPGIMILYTDQIQAY